MPLYTTICTAKSQSNILHRGSETIFLKNQREDSLSPGPRVLHHTVPIATRLQHCWTKAAHNEVSLCCSWICNVLQRPKSWRFGPQATMLCEREYYKEDGFIEGVVLKRYGDSAPPTHTSLLPSHHEASSFLNMLLLPWHLLPPQTQNHQSSWSCAKISKSVT